MIALLYIWDLISNIHDAPSLGVGVLDHNLGAPLEKPIPGVSPWDLLVGLDVLAQGLRKWKLFTPFFSVVVTLLDIIQLEVFVPVTHAGFVGVFWSSL